MANQRLLSLLQSVPVTGQHRTFLREIALADGGNGADLRVAATTLVSKNGNDSTGERGNLAKPFLTLQAAIDASSGEDTILLAPGDYGSLGDTTIVDKSLSFLALGSPVNTEVLGVFKPNANGLAVTLDSVHLEELSLDQAGTVTAEACVIDRLTTAEAMSSAPLVTLKNTEVGTILLAGAILEMKSSGGEKCAIILAGGSDFSLLADRATAVQSITTREGTELSIAGSLDTVNYHGEITNTLVLNFSDQKTDNTDLSEAQIHGLATFTTSSTQGMSINARGAQFYAGIYAENTNAGESAKNLVIDNRSGYCLLEGGETSETGYVRAALDRDSAVIRNEVISPDELGAFTVSLNRRDNPPFPTGAQCVWSVQRADAAPANFSEVPFLSNGTISYKEATFAIGSDNPIIANFTILRDDHAVLGVGPGPGPGGP